MLDTNTGCFPTPINIKMPLIFLSFGFRARAKWMAPSFSACSKTWKTYQDQVSSPNRTQIMALKGFALAAPAGPKWPMAIRGTCSWNIETPSSPSFFLASKTYLSPQISCFYLFSFSRYYWLKNFTLVQRPLNFNAQYLENENR